MRIIDNKKIDLTQHEWDTYQAILKSYDQGAELFKDLFETDENGIIIFLKPPSKRFTSLEVITFLQSTMLHQHIRLMYAEITKGTTELHKLMAEAQQLMIEGRQLIEELKGSRAPAVE